MFVKIVCVFVALGAVVYALFKAMMSTGFESPHPSTLGPLDYVVPGIVLVIAVCGMIWGH